MLIQNIWYELCGASFFCLLYTLLNTLLDCNPKKMISKIILKMSRFRSRSLMHKKVLMFFFTQRHCTTPEVYINGVSIEQTTKAKYQELTLNSRLAYRDHIANAIAMCNAKRSKLYWLLSKRSELALRCKQLIYQQIIAPTWTNILQIWGIVPTSNRKKD